MKFTEEFKKFRHAGEVVDLAVGVRDRGGVRQIVDSLVKEHVHAGDRTDHRRFDVSGQTLNYHDAKIGWGNFLQSVINFVIIGFCLFLVVKAMNQLMKKEEAKPGRTDREWKSC